VLEECIVCAKGTSQAKVMSNNEKIKPVALAVIKLCWPGQLASYSENYILFQKIL